MESCRSYPKDRLFCSVTRNILPQPTSGADIPIQAIISTPQAMASLTYLINYGPQTVIPMTSGPNGGFSIELSESGFFNKYRHSHLPQNWITFLHIIMKSREERSALLSNAASVETSEDCILGC